MHFIYKWLKSAVFLPERVNACMPMYVRAGEGAQGYPKLVARMAELGREISAAVSSGGRYL